MTRPPGLRERLVAAAVRRRERMPSWARRAMESVAKNPDGLLSRAVARALGAGGAPPPPTTVPDTPVRVYIGPTNYAGQGWMWCRALEASDPQIGARNLSLEIPGTFAFRADSSVPLVVQNGSRAWREQEFAAVSRFTHVLVEAERVLFGPLFGWDLGLEREALEAEGVSVAYLAHGTDVRSPRAHRSFTPWSPFADGEQDERLQLDADANIAFLERVGRPVFVSTPDLLADMPDAIWCPVAVDVGAWSTDAPPARGERVVVMHAPSSGHLKGTALIEPHLHRLAAEGVLDYRRITGVPSSRMPTEVAGCDIVLDQFRLGSYGAAAVEGMAAGRVVVGHVTAFVRDRVRKATGLELPIVEATPDTLDEVLRSLVANPDGMRAIAARGPEFVTRVHSGAWSARALVENWIGGS